MEYMYNDPKISISGSVILLETPYELKDICKSIPGRRWNPDKKVWEVPIHSIDMVLDKFCRHNLVLSQEVKDKLHEIEKIKELSNAAANNRIISFGESLTLLPYQSVGVQFLNLANGKALLADEMGLGKTIQALAWLRIHPELRPAIIICPASLKINWLREAEKWLDKLDIVKMFALETSLDERKGTVLIDNYDMLGKHLDSLGKLKAKAIILDESHFVKNPKSYRSRAVTVLSETIPNRILLTGTPVLNRPVELWKQLNIIDPDLFPKFFPYAIRYCNARRTKWGWNFNGASNTIELNNLIKSLMIRRLKSQVMNELPDKRRSLVPFTIDNRGEYKKAQNDFVDFILRASGESADKRTASGQVLAEIELLKQIAVKGKLKEIKSWIEDMIESGEKLVVFAHHVFVIEDIFCNFRKVAVKLTGSDSQTARQDAVDEFQNNPNVKLFIGNMKAAGVGITLTAASNVAFVEFPWTPGDVSQCEDRLHRIGQKNAVNVWFLMAEDTIEEKILKLIRRKSNVVNSVTDGTDIHEGGIFNELLDEMKRLNGSANSD